MFLARRLSCQRYRLINAQTLYSPRGPTSFKSLQERSGGRGGSLEWFFKAGGLTEPEWGWLIGLLWDWPTGLWARTSMWHHWLVSMELASESELDRPPPATSHHISVLHLERAPASDSCKTNRHLHLHKQWRAHVHRTHNCNAAHTACTHKLIKPIARD